MDKRFFIWIAIFIPLAVCQTQAQETVDLSTKNVCGWNKEVTQKTVYTFATGEDDSVRIYVREICKREALDYSFGVAAANVDNVIATIDNGQRYIYYSRAFFESLPNHWYKLAILAHEIGHHINNNITGSGERPRPEQELAADRFSGKVLCEFGAPHSVIRQLLVETCSEKGSAFYPDRSARLEAFLDGYVVAGCHSTSPTPARTVNTTPATTSMPGFNAFSLQKTFRDLPFEIRLNDKHHLLLDDHVPGEVIGVRDMFSGNVIKTFPGKEDGCGINNSDHVLVAARPSEDSVVVYDYASQKPLHRFLAPGATSHIKFSPRDRFIGIQTGERLYLFDLAGGKEINTFNTEGHSSATGDFCFSPDEKLLAVAENKGITIYSLETLRVVRKISLPEDPGAFQFIPHKDQLVWASGENYFRIIDLEGKQIREIKMIEKESELAAIDKEYDWGDNPRVFTLAVSPDGKYIAAAGSITSGRIRIFTPQGNLVQTIREEHRGGVLDLRYSSDGRYLITDGGGARNFIRVYRNF